MRASPNKDYGSFAGLSLNSSDLNVETKSSYRGLVTSRNSRQTQKSIPVDLKEEEIKKKIISLLSNLYM